MYALDNIDETKAYYGVGMSPVLASSQSYLVLDVELPAESLDTKLLFEKYVKKWKKETSHISQVSQRLQHPDYKRILNLGRHIVPSILKDLEKDPDHWFHALLYLTGENPIPSDFSGTVTDAAQIWIDWGKTKYAT